MNLTTALSVRDETIKDCLTDIFSEVLSPKDVDRRISKAFEEMNHKWKERLVFMISEEQAAQVFEALEKPLPPHEIDLEIAKE